MNFLKALSIYLKIKKVNTEYVSPLRRHDKRPIEKKKKTFISKDLIHVEWHDWFAWKPVRSTKTLKILWLKKIQRKEVISGVGGRYFVYKES